MNREDTGIYYYLYFAWLIALVATGGSLYFSEIAGFTPCELCWIQRILMYPLVIMLGMACFRGDRHIIPYVLPLSIIGGGFSLYHYIEQKATEVPSVCSGDAVPCSGAYMNLLGFITIPFLALIAFALITGVLIFSYFRS